MHYVGMHAGHPDAIKLAAKAEADPRTAAKFLKGEPIKGHALRARLVAAAAKLKLKRQPPPLLRGKRCEVCGAQAWLQVHDVVHTTEPGEIGPRVEPDGEPHFFCKRHGRESRTRVERELIDKCLSMLA